ncbi:hypothetical protein Ple7327_1770 [Pleurocapsa sp. PCC 7327]|uniref:LIC_10190 family membrane protein n=1 Tax=Pleurocapsa sp. PCC 7327 TaxID=118163 RepID=UPI00029FFAF8|nr:hypothetical protein [Pleurocapsa sp. PCC 7327]AFY77123.1 hypothetical protein Ple7327_1770 [Pleurocapsa sp. PCC 7327]
MLYTLVVWTILIFVCPAIGIAVLNWLKADCFDRRSDRLMIAVWLGTIAPSISLLAVSLVVPLSPLVGGTVAIALVALSLGSRQARREIFSFRVLLSPKLITGFLAIEIIVAALTTQQINWFDTGLYHLGSIQWLSQFGAVPGLALIHSRFGFTSSWFAFSAPLTPQFLGDRVGAITNGFVFLIYVFHFLICLQRGITKNLRLSDWFFIFFSSVIICAYTLSAFLNESILVSFSPDVPITLLIGVTAWSILLISNYYQSLLIENNTSHLDAYLIPLILSVGAVSIKLSAIPLLAIGFLFYVFGKKLAIKRVFVGVILVAIALLPNALFSITTSGCPLYPSQFMCVDLPWSVPEQTIVQETSKITGLDMPSGSDNFLLEAFQKRFTWIKSSIKLQIMLLLFVTSLILSIWMLITSRSSNPPKMRGQNWIIALGILGTSFIYTKIPLLRFALGYLIAIPALFLAKYYLVRGEKNFLLSHFFKIIELTRVKQFARLGAIGLAVVSLAIAGGQSRLVFPSKLPSFDLIYAKINDVEYTYPANWTNKCWITKLPCSEVGIKNDIKLRNPAKGIGAGFILNEPKK